MPSYLSASFHTEPEAYAPVCLQRRANYYYLEARSKDPAEAICSFAVQAGASRATSASTASRRSSARLRACPATSSRATSTRPRCAPRQRRQQSAQGWMCHSRETAAYQEMLRRSMGRTLFMWLDQRICCQCMLGTSCWLAVSLPMPWSIVILLVEPSVEAILMPLLQATVDGGAVVLCAAAPGQGHQQQGHVGPSSMRCGPMLCTTLIANSNSSQLESASCSRGRLHAYQGLFASEPALLVKCSHPMALCCAPCRRCLSAAGCSTAWHGTPVC